MTKPFKEGKGWAIRLRLRGQDIYQSGFASEAKARKALASLLYEVENADKAAGLGPHRTPLAVAFSSYVLQCLPYLKGAEKDGNPLRVAVVHRVVGKIAGDFPAWVSRAFIKAQQWI